MRPDVGERRNRHRVSRPSIVVGERHAMDPREHHNQISRCRVCKKMPGENIDIRLWPLQRAHGRPDAGNHDEDRQKHPEPAQSGSPAENDDRLCSHRDDRRQRHVVPALRRKPEQKIEGQQCTGAERAHSDGVRASGSFGGRTSHTGRRDHEHDNPDRSYDPSGGLQNLPQS